MEFDSMWLREGVINYRARAIMARATISHKLHATIYTRLCRILLSFTTYLCITDKLWSPFTV